MRILTQSSCCSWQQDRVVLPHKLRLCLCDALYLMPHVVAPFMGAYSNRDWNIGEAETRIVEPEHVGTIQIQEASYQRSRSAVMSEPISAMVTIEQFIIYVERTTRAHYRVVGKYRDSVTSKDISARILDRMQQQWSTHWGTPDGARLRQGYAELEHLLAQLYDCLVGGRISSLYHAARSAAKPEEFVVCLLLPPELWRLPWEWAFHSVDSLVPGLEQTTIVRYFADVNSDLAAAASAENEIGRVFVVASDPQQLASIQESLLAAIEACDTRLRLESLGAMNKRVSLSGSSGVFGRKHTLDLEFQTLAGLHKATEYSGEDKRLVNVVHFCTEGRQLFSRVPARFETVSQTVSGATNDSTLGEFSVAEVAQRLASCGADFVVYSADLDADSLEQASTLASELCKHGVKGVVFVPEAVTNGSALLSAAVWYMDLLGTGSIRGATKRALRKTTSCRLPDGTAAEVSPLAFGRPIHVLPTQHGKRDRGRHSLFTSAKAAVLFLVSVFTLLVTASQAPAGLEWFRRETPFGQCAWPLPFSPGGLDIVVSGFQIQESASAALSAAEANLLSAAVAAQLQGLLPQIDRPD